MGVNDENLISNILFSLSPAPPELEHILLWTCLLNLEKVVTLGFLIFR